MFPAVCKRGLHAQSANTNQLLLSCTLLHGNGICKSDVFLWTFLPSLSTQISSGKKCNLPSVSVRSLASEILFHVLLSVPCPCTLVCFGRIGVRAHEQAQWVVWFLLYLLSRCPPFFKKRHKKRRKWHVDLKRSLHCLEKKIVDGICVCISM